MFFISFIFGWFASNCYSNVLTTESLISLVLVAVTIISFILTLYESEKIYGPHIQMYTKIEDNGFVTLYIENIGQGSASSLEFEIKGRTEINDISSLVFFRKTHESYPAKQMDKFAVALFSQRKYDEGHEYPTCDVLATYIGTFGKQMKCKVIIDPNIYNMVEIVA